MQTSLSALSVVPDSMLGTMFSGRHKIHKQKNGSVFIDRDGTHFRVILNYLRGEISSKSQLTDNNLHCRSYLLSAIFISFRS